jgi:hypothetical protein
MPALGAGIHDFAMRGNEGHSWMAGPSPAMTIVAPYAIKTLEAETQRRPESLPHTSAFWNISST